jgi:hypothetical protein
MPRNVDERVKWKDSVPGLMLSGKVEFIISEMAGTEG